MYVAVLAACKPQALGRTLLGRKLGQNSMGSPSAGSSSSALMSVLVLRSFCVRAAGRIPGEQRSSVAPRICDAEGVIVSARQHLVDAGHQSCFAFFHVVRIERQAKHRLQIEPVAVHTLLRPRVLGQTHEANRRASEVVRSFAGTLIRRMRCKELQFWLIADSAIDSGRRHQVSANPSGRQQSSRSSRSVGSFDASAAARRTRCAARASCGFQFVVPPRAADLPSRIGPSSVNICSLWTMPVEFDEIGMPASRTSSYRWKSTLVRPWPRMQLEVLLRRERRGQRGQVAELQFVRRGERRVERRVARQVAPRMLRLLLQQANFRLSAHEPDIELRLLHDDERADDRDERRGDPSPLDAAHRVEDQPVKRHERDQIRRQAHARRTLRRAPRRRPPRGALREPRWPWH